MDLRTLLIIAVCLSNSINVQGTPFSYCRYRVHTNVSKEERRTFLLILRKVVTMCGSKFVSIVADLPKELRKVKVVERTTEVVCFAYRVCHSSVKLNATKQRTQTLGRRDVALITDCIVQFARMADPLSMSIILHLPQNVTQAIDVDDIFPQLTECYEKHVHTLPTTLNSAFRMFKTFTQKAVDLGKSLLGETE